MKARPRRVENRVADELNVYFDHVGLSRVERKPIIGRTGPDLTWNELGLIIDVKSRIAVPKSIFKFPSTEIAYFRNPDKLEIGLVGTALHNMGRLINDQIDPVTIDFLPKSVIGWFEHMDEWTSGNEPDGVTALVLHRPRMSIHNSILVIHPFDRSVLTERLYEFKRKHRSD